MAIRVRSWSVREAMQKHVVALPARLLAAEAVDVLLEHRITGAPVVTPDGEVVGVVSLMDLVASLPQATASPKLMHPPPEFYQDLWADDDLDEVEVSAACTLTVQDAMSPVVFTVSEDDPIEKAVRLMLEARIHRVLVVGPDGVAGILTSMDLIALLPVLIESMPW